jgi:diaminopropionate ammonia-lyase
VLTVTDTQVASHLAAIAQMDLATTPSGGAGLAALMDSAPHHNALGLSDTSRILTFVTEEP